MSPTPNWIAPEKELNPGAVVLVNDDDDDGDGKIDNTDPDGVPTGDNDLHNLAIGPVDPLAASGKFKLIFGSDKIKIWSSNKKLPNEEIISGNTEFDATVRHDLWVEGFAQSTEVAKEIVSLQWEKNNKGKAEKIENLDKVAYTVAKIDFNAYSVKLNTPNGLLADDIEVSQGAYLPVNSDRDRYSPTAEDREYNTEGSSKTEHENDLLKMTVAAIQPAIEGTVYKLVIPGHVRVWTNAIKDGAQVTNDTLLTPGKDGTIDLWVEGYEGPTSDNIKLRWGSTKTSQIIDHADRVRLNTFVWWGPLNVPGHTKYTYSAKGGKAGADSAWVNSDSGTNENAVEGDPDKVTVLWDSGPVVGGPVYKAAPDFEWKLDVNIVQIKLEDMSLTPGTAAGVGPMCKGQAMEALVATTSATTGAGMTAKAKVTITGPTVDGVQRGVRYMEVGFLQVSTTRDQFHMTGNLGGDTVKILHYLENNTRYLDQITKNCAGQSLNTEWPWYDGTGLAGVGFYEGTTELQQVTRSMEIQDTPWMPILTQNFKYDDKSWPPTRIDINWRFELNIAARTRDGDAKEELKNFTQLAQGVWQWEGDAKFDDATAKWVPDNASVTKVNNLAATANGALVKWDAEPLNNYIYPWLEDDGTPHSKHEVQ